MKSRPDSQLNLPPLEVQRSDREGESLRPESGLSLDAAKVQIGRALRRAIRGTDSALKEFGDPSHVNRVCDGEIPSVIARAWLQRHHRRAFITALAEESGLFTVRFSLEEIA